jgi:hypothetical protein
VFCCPSFYERWLVVSDLGSDREDGNFMTDIFSKNPKAFLLRHF